MGFCEAILVVVLAAAAADLLLLGRLVEWRRASTSRPLRGLMSFRLRLRLWTRGGTFCGFETLDLRRMSI